MVLIHYALNKFCHCLLTLIMKDDIVKNVLVFYFPYNENQRDQMLNEHNTFKKEKKENFFFL